MALPVRRGNGSARPRAVQRWEPFRELQELQEQTQELMQSVWSGAGPLEAAVWAPPVDIEETDDAWIVEAEVPGVDRDDVNVEVRDNELEISGEIKEHERKGILRRRTRRVGQFDFRVTVPGAIDAEQMDARLEDGVLTIRIPKPEQARPRRIQVKAGAS
jgi:HSP20 family protein